jgi:hypothetical protein
MNNNMTKRVENRISCCASDCDLFRRDAVVVLNRCDEPRHAVVPHSTFVKQSAVCFGAAEAPSVFGVRVTNGKFFGELGVHDEMLSMPGTVYVNRKGAVAFPFARFVASVPVDATGTCQIRCPDATGHEDDEKKPRRERVFHAQTLSWV